MKCNHSRAHSFLRGGQTYLRCPCGMQTITPRDNAIEAFLHRREDWREAEALRSAEAAKAGS